MARQAIEISDDEESKHSDLDFDRRDILAPVIGRVVDALGGYEGDVYVMGDSVHGCLKDLKKLWRKDETDDERTVARLFWEMRVLPKDLIPILLQTAGQGLVEDKRAITCVDLITAMTWPIDLAEELKELDEELDKGTDYTQLVQSHLHYKSALLTPGVIQAMFGIMLPPLSKHSRERVERDGQVINVVLHLIRNLAFIKDIPTNSHHSAELSEFANMQSKLILALSETHTLDLLLTIASNTENDILFNNWNTLVLEILYLLFRGVKPTSLTIDQAKRPAENLRRLLEIENRSKQEISRKTSSRHSRFGTTVSVRLNSGRSSQTEGDTSSRSGDGGRSVILHRQRAIVGDSGSVMDISKRQKAKKVTRLDEFGLLDNLSMESRVILQNLACDFTESCFNSFLSGLLKDIRSERPKITEKDNLRLLYMTKWFLEFFLAMQLSERETKTVQPRWNFGVIAEVTERHWIIWVLRRMREAVEEKPKLWIELQAGIECLTQLILLIDKMAASNMEDLTLQEAADTLQQQIIYNGEILDIALESLKTYKPGTQSLAYLDSSVHLSYALLRMMESWGKTKGSDTYVRTKVTKRRKKKAGISEEEGIPDVEELEEEPDDDTVNETMFTFEAFEAKFAQAEVTHTLLAYLSRYREFSSSEKMRRVVSLLHRQAVKTKAEGLFFKVSTLSLFKKILADQRTLPRDQPYKDLINLVNFILRQFFKALEKDSFLAVEAFFPKNRGHWKQYSSWEAESKSKKNKATLDTRFPADVEVKKGFSWSEQLGIAVAALVDEGQTKLVKWTTEILALVISIRTHIIAEVDGEKNDTDIDHSMDVGDAERVGSIKGPSADAQAKITDYLIPYIDDEQGDAATKHPYLKLLWRLCKFYVLDEESDELEWYIPSAILVEESQRTLTVINQFLEAPMALDGKKPTQLLNKKRRRRRRRSPSPDSESDNALEDEPRRKRVKERRQKEKEIYKSAQFIEDSDAEYGDMDAFLEKERLARERAVQAAAAAGLDRPDTMKATGTKKRRRKGVPDTTSKRQKSMSKASESEVEDEHINPEDANANAADSRTTVNRPRPRPRPKARTSEGSSEVSRLSPPSSEADDLRDRSASVEDAAVSGQSRTHRAKRLILSDSDD